MTNAESELKRYLRTKVFDVEHYFRFIGSAFGRRYEDAIYTLTKDGKRSKEEAWLMILSQEKRKWEPRYTTDGGTYIDDGKIEEAVTDFDRGYSAGYRDAVKTLI